MSVCEEKQRVARLYTEVYYGDGIDNPPILLRLDRLEQVLADLKTWKWTLIAAIITMIADIISNHVKF